MRKLKLISLLFAVFMLSESLFAAEGVTRVQTLTFDSLVSRRAVWKFPDEGKTYRKIIMNYTLKCDPKTAWDKFNCGEWDYLTYMVVKKHTGIYDSVLSKIPKYLFGGSFPDTIKYIPLTSSNPPKHIKREKFYTVNFSNAADEVSFEIGAKDKEFKVSSKPFKIQYFITKNELKDLGIGKNTFSKLSLSVKSGSGLIKNFRVKYKALVSTDLSAFDANPSELYYANQTFNTGENVLNLYNTISTSTIQGLLIELSGDGSTSGDIVFDAFTPSKGIYTEETPKFMEFDNNADYLKCENTSLLKGVNKFTMEAYIRLDEHKNWAKLFGFGDRFFISLGDKEGDLFVFNRNPVNTYGSAKSVLLLNQWAHIAIVFDGTKEKNSDKLKLYINGENIGLAYSSSYIPERTSDDYSPFTISNVPQASMFNGGIYEMRVYNSSVSQNDIKLWKDKKITNAHPNYNDLVIYYPLDKQLNYVVSDESGKGNNAIIAGIPEIKTSSISNVLSGNIENINAPFFKLYSGTYEKTIDSTTSDTEIPASFVSIVERNIQNYRPDIANQILAYPAGYYYTYDENNKKIDSLLFAAESQLINDTIEYYQRPFEIIEDIEIARFITPYGINLDLGPDGFKWTCDVTDYADLLKGDVDIEAGNFQELIDMSFDFYEGIPPRNLIKMTEIWGHYRPISYRKLSGDEELSEKEINITKSTEQVKLKSRLTGHGHHSNTGEPPHCCEWKDNEHFLFVNKQQAASWHIWRDDCSVNPVYPQGGTWPGLREGWCPGDMVRDFDFELTPYIADGKMTIDYGITPVPQDNLGMGTGDYVVSMQVFEYGKANHEMDAEVYDIITPSLEQIYSRRNPVCKGPVIVIRNNGTSNLTSLAFEYGVSGAKQEIYSWNGNLKPNLRDTVELPIPNSAFWLGDANRIFSVKVKMPNGQDDMYAVNDTMTSGFQIPDLIAKGTKLKLRTHNYGDILHLVVKDLAGNVVLNRNVLQSNTEYIENIDFSDGCYTLELTNDYDFGLSYWAVSSQGTGYLQLLNENNQVIKTFNPDFGRSIVYSYHSGNISYIEDSQMDYLLRIFPLPAENAVNIQIDTQIGEAVMELFDFSGKSILTQNINLPEAAPMKLDVSNLSSGNYFIRIYNSQFDMKRTFIKK